MFPRGDMVQVFASELLYLLVFGLAVGFLMGGAVGRWSKTKKKKGRRKKRK